MDMANEYNSSEMAIEERIRNLLAEMTLEEKAGQLNQVQWNGWEAFDALADDVRAGRVGSVINLVDRAAVDALQTIARQESRHGIPLLIGRDVIHGFHTVMPLPLAQAASWNPDLVRDCARISAQEAAVTGVNWTFAPMIDVSRDPRWGRVAESFGEDPYLTSVMGAAMIDGYQTSDPAAADTLLACAKHFAGYGASEGGRDYNSTNIPPNEMRNVHLPPFKAAVEAGAATFMTSFGDIDGVPASGNEWLLTDVLREEWSFDGMVVSDWESITQLCTHGMCEDEVDAALVAAEAGVDMDMVSGVYSAHLPHLCESGEISMDRIDQLVGNILRTKIRAGLIDGDRLDQQSEEPARLTALAVARQAATESCVLLRNEMDTLPLSSDQISSLAVIGPMANEPAEQMGTWVFDGKSERSVTPLDAITSVLEGQAEVDFEPGLETTRSHDKTHFARAIEAAASCDVAVLFIGEEAILSGEAHCRADITLPGAQADLVRAIRQTGKPVIGVIMAGRPLALGDVIEEFDALVYAWHGGSMSGPALADLLFGRAVPSGKLPVTFPKVSGQVPIYYGHKNTGRPPEADTVIHIDDIEKGAPQTSLGMTSFLLDAGYEPLFPFGFGLSYTKFAYSDLHIDRHEMSEKEMAIVTATVTNTGTRTASEITQLYIRDRVARITRPVRELKAFRRQELAPGESVQVEFRLSVNELAYYHRDGSFQAEPGDFDIWVGGDSRADLHTSLRLLKA